MFDNEISELLNGERIKHVRFALAVHALAYTRHTATATNVRWHHNRTQIFGKFSKISGNLKILQVIFSEKNRVDEQPTQMGGVPAATASQRGFG